jgi:hypothetical protein
MTGPQESLIRLVRICGPRSITRGMARKHGLEADFKRVLRAGLIQSAGYECSVKADDWLESAAGNAALTGEPANRR